MHSAIRLDSVRKETLFGIVRKETVMYLIRVSWKGRGVSGVVCVCVGGGGGFFFIFFHR